MSSAGVGTLIVGKSDNGAPPNKKRSPQWRTPEETRLLYDQHRNLRLLDDVVADAAEHPFPNRA